MSRLKGAKDLVQEAVDKGASAVQKVHKQVASRPFRALDLIPGINLPARGVRAVHDAIVDLVYDSVRAINGLVGDVTGEVIEAFDPASDESAPDDQKPQNHETPARRDADERR